MCLCAHCVSLCPPLGPPHSSEDEEDDTIHMGNAVMTFYAALIDLLGRCAPEMHVKAYTHAHARTHTDTHVHTHAQTYAPTHTSHHIWIIAVGEGITLDPKSSKRE